MCSQVDVYIHIYESFWIDIMLICYVYVFILIYGINPILACVWLSCVCIFLTCLFGRGWRRSYSHSQDPHDRPYPIIICYILLYVHALSYGDRFTGTRLLGMNAKCLVVIL